MDQKKVPSNPDFIMETSWEVCNKVGGIYTVLSTRAATMVEREGSPKSVLFIGPLLDLPNQKDFIFDSDLDEKVGDPIKEKIGLSISMGYWDVPGRPMVALVDYKPLFNSKDKLYYEMWEAYGIRSEIGYGDYDDSALFSVAAAKVMMAYYDLYLRSKEQSVIAIFNEWTTGMGLLYTKLHEPNIHSLFITHATSVGRSIAGNGKDLYRYMKGYNGDQMAFELHVECKHMLEKAAAHECDAFGTVSAVTDVECAQLLERPVDKVVPNGFEPRFVPDQIVRHKLSLSGRKKIRDIASTLYAMEIPEDALIVATSGRCEYRNKGLDIVVDVLSTLATNGSNTPIIALILVPGWVRGIRQDLALAQHIDYKMTLRMMNPFITHELNEPYNNPIYNALESRQEQWGRSVFPLFIPSYLNGNDGIIDISYYDLLNCVDLSLFPSYYEPWGYTPLESIAFGIPTITTDKAGFGVWASTMINTENIEGGVLVLPRDDENGDEVVREITKTIEGYNQLDHSAREVIRANARELASQADWDHFYPFYEELYRIAFSEKYRDTNRDDKECH